MYIYYIPKTTNGRHHEYDLKKTCNNVRVRVWWGDHVRQRPNKRVRFPPRLSCRRPIPCIRHGAPVVTENNHGLLRHFNYVIPYPNWTDPIRPWEIGGGEPQREGPHIASRPCPLTVKVRKRLRYVRVVFVFTGRNEKRSMPRIGQSPPWRDRKKGIITIIMCM